MRTPKPYLGLFALALLIPMLLLACGGSDEPTYGPSSERASAEPTGRSFSGQTTPEPTTPSAEPPPTPRAPAKTPLAETSPETDREALASLYNATNGKSWFQSANWLSDASMGEWYGVTTDDDGRVKELDLDNNKLSGEIPPELGSLSNLTNLYLNYNDLSGEIPPELGSLSNLSPNPPMGGVKAGQIGMREPTREKAWAPLGPM